MCVPYICPQQNLWAFICLCLCLGVHACACVRTAGCVSVPVFVSVRIWAFVPVCVAAGLCLPAWLCLSACVLKGHRVSLVCAGLSGLQAAPWKARLYLCVPTALAQDRECCAFEAAGLDLSVSKCEYVTVSLYVRLPCAVA